MSSDPSAELSSTALHILDVAEPLFARHGIEKVSFRDLVAASGQRNISAVSYHFGDRPGLLQAMVARRMWVLNVDRLARLDALAREGRGGEVHAVVAEAFGVLADAVRQQHWGRDFVLILSQLLFHPDMSIEALVSPELTGSIETARRMARRVLKELPLAVFNERVDMVYHQGVYALAMWVQANGPVTPDNAGAYERFVRNTVDFLAGGLMAPVSPARRARTAHSRG
ncbi:helix-turn-helix domain-containing protein [Pelomonas sp. KK5]|uniref:helix-turn-helix domain-containing protein n=1 Tax=Pelomonas sp. KK5 TaxID=1855730 RepID=UPI00097C5B3E|nr:helix-turn-helix domain-containing protein [Pelomonas sp. KK5]